MLDAGLATVLREAAWPGRIHENFGSFGRY
jgi:hypothetical protein